MKGVVDIESPEYSIYVDGSCLENIMGCTDPTACNYNPEATEDDGLCEYIDQCGICGGDDPYVLVVKINKHVIGEVLLL